MLAGISVLNNGQGRACTVFVCLFTFTVKQRMIPQMTMRDPKQVKYYIVSLKSPQSTALAYGKDCSPVTAILLLVGLEVGLFLKINIFFFTHEN
jgi:hypothetical protein